MKPREVTGIGLKSQLKVGTDGGPHLLVLLIKVLQGASMGS